MHVCIPDFRDFFLFQRMVHVFPLLVQKRSDIHTYIHTYRHTYRQTCIHTYTYVVVLFVCVWYYK